jgi:uracil phosphoribosyltransferase
LCVVVVPLQLFYYKMPRKLSECRVIIMDPMLATGESLKMVFRLPTSSTLLSTLSRSHSLVSK